MLVMEFGNAIKECGELILIPWCVFYFITSTCGIQFVQRTLSITGEEMRATKNEKRTLAPVTALTNFAASTILDPTEYMGDTYPLYLVQGLIQTVSTVSGRDTVDTVCIVSQRIWTGV